MADDPIFPPEVFEIIIGEHADDLDTLRSCSLVSWTFYSLARLFFRLQVGPQVDQEHSLAKLCELLEASPYFAARVRSLRLCDKWTIDRPSFWISEADLGRCFSVLGSLTRLCLAFSSNTASKLVWTMIPVANHDSIQAVLPTLTCLEIHNVKELPFTFLSRCFSLRSLTLHNVNIANNSGSTTTRAMGPCIPLRQLFLHASGIQIGTLVDWITSSCDLSRLFLLECVFYNLHKDLAIERLLDASAQSLQHLCMVNYSLFIHHQCKLNLHQLVRLRTLTLNIWLDMVSSISSHQRLLSLDHIVLPPLQKLALVLNLQSDNPRPESFQKFASADSALAALPSITSVKVVLWHRILKTPPHTRNEPLIDISDEFIQQMPLLARRLADTGGLHVFKSVWPNA
ncbi:hypothetical protein C8R45DRAFT_990157 [Mycena sanguinolenta]|nr:hypothetical protein C8R45DRAFT_990157 [Mycena sanguinolenta]